MSLIEARGKEALTAVAQACGGEDKYRVRFEGPGHVQARYLGNFQITTSCNRSHVGFFIRPTDENARACTVTVVSRKPLQTEFVDRTWEPSVVEDFKQALGRR